MIPDDGGGRRPLRQAPSPRSRRHWADINGETTPCKYAPLSTNRSVLAFSRSQCDGHHSGAPRDRISQHWWRALSTDSKEGLIAGGDRTPKEDNSALPRLRGLVRNRGPRADLPQRGEKSAAPALFSAGSGAALAIVSGCSPNGKLHMHTAVDPLRAGITRSRRSPAVPVPNPIRRRGAAGLRAAVKLTDPIRLWPVLSETGVIGHRFAILRAFRIVLGARASRPSESGKAQRGRGAGGHAFSP
jgi:hypothetical protein